MPEDMSDRIPEDLPTRMPEDMPDRMPEDMSDRMPEDLPVRKCVNAMVGMGIIRSEVIFNKQINSDYFLPTKSACTIRFNKTARVATELNQGSWEKSSGKPRNFTRPISQ